MAELKPCPFCNDEGILKETFIICGTTHTYFAKRFLIVCKYCGNRTKKHNSSKSAIEAWNRRADH